MFFSIYISIRNTARHGRNKLSREPCKHTLLRQRVKIQSAINAICFSRKMQISTAAVALRERRRGDTHPPRRRRVHTPFPTFAVGFDLYASHDAGCALYDLYVPRYAGKWRSREIVGRTPSPAGDVVRRVD